MQMQGEGQAWGGAGHGVGGGCSSGTQWPGLWPARFARGQWLGPGFSPDHSLWLSLLLRQRGFWVRGQEGVCGHTVWSAAGAREGVDPWEPGP